MTQDKTPQHIKLDERDHVENPLLDQLAGLGWEIRDLDSKQQSSKAFVFTENRKMFCKEKIPCFLTKGNIVGLCNIMISKYYLRFMDMKGLCHYPK